MGKEQCAYCKEEGHWKTNCPKLKNKKDNKRKSLSNGKKRRTL